MLKIPLKKATDSLVESLQRNTKLVGMVNTLWAYSAYTEA